MRFAHNDKSPDLKSEISDAGFRRLIGFLFFIALALSNFSPRFALSADASRDEAPSRALVTAAFNSDCEKTLITRINLAEEEILVAIYNITRKNVTGALARAAKRGVKVTVKYDVSSHHDSRTMPEAIEYLSARGARCVAVKMSEKDGRMHNKFTVVDRKVVITGSFNYTTAASTLNYENIVVIQSSEIAKQFADEFGRIKSK